MVNAVDTANWKIIGKSVRGASHERSGLPNQDAIDWFPNSGQWLPLVLALSDGHGSRKCFRSDRGARFAVSAALDVAKAITETHGASGRSIKKMAEEQIPKQIHRCWKVGVDKDIQEFPFTEEEKLLSDANPYLPYGATLLLAIITSSFFLFLQLGDGDILVIRENGDAQRPVPQDERLLGNETTSLSAPDAWKDFRFCFLPVLDTIPGLIMLATDGYANSFQDDQNFRKVGTDILEIAKSEGIAYIENNLEQWLRTASASGSGDDITVGLVFHLV
ncbi:MAG: PP2C family serine/threonine-protein phosphatase [Desulfococcaceae bacterium]